MAGSRNLLVFIFVYCESVIAGRVSSSSHPPPPIALQPTMGLGLFSAQPPDISIL